MTLLEFQVAHRIQIDWIHHVIALAVTDHAEVDIVEVAAHFGIRGSQPEEVRVALRERGLTGWMVRFRVRHADSVAHHLCHISDHMLTDEALQQALQAVVGMAQEAEQSTGRV